MPRKPRQIEIGQIQQIINRSIEGRKIFSKDQDYSRFILALEFFNYDEPTDIWPLLFSLDYKSGNIIRNKDFKRLIEERERRKKNPKPLVEILGFVLMPTHFHLILREIKKGGISKFMKKMGGYASYFNKQNNRVGPLFQNRFKNFHVNTESYLIRLFVYVHTNPVELIEPGWKDWKVKDVKKAIDFIENKYKWSSYMDFLGKKNFPFVANRELMLKTFGGVKDLKGMVRNWISSKRTKDEISIMNEIAEFSNK